MARAVHMGTDMSRDQQVKIETEQYKWGQTCCETNRYSSGQNSTYGDGHVERPTGTAVARTVQMGTDMSRDQQVEIETETHTKVKMEYINTTENK